MALSDGGGAIAVTLKLDGRKSLHPDYERGFFERPVREVFALRRSEQLGSDVGTLYFATPKGAPS